MQKSKQSLFFHFLRILSIFISIALLVQLPKTNRIAYGASSYYFRGYDNENIVSATFSFSDAHTHWSGSDIVTDDPNTGEAIGFIALDDAGHDISAPVDLGGLEIDFSTITSVVSEGTNGSENDEPSVSISFCHTNFSNVISTIDLHKADNSVSGLETLTSHASIPEGTRSIIVHLYAENTNTSSGNTVVFKNPSLVIHDAAAPTCNVSYNSAWTNEDVSVTVTASDGDSGLEGIYLDGQKVSSTSPYTFVASQNESHSVYSRDYAAKTSESKTIDITNIDKSVPSAPQSLTLSCDSWSNADVDVTVPTLPQSSGSPEGYVYRLNGGGWADLDSDFSVTQNGQFTIEVAVEDEAGNRSTALSDIIYIDKLTPSISGIQKTVSSGSCAVSLSVADVGLSGIKSVLYAAGSHDAAYFGSGGTAIQNGSFSVPVGGVYTICAFDNAGNHALTEVTLNTSPTMLSIADKAMQEDVPANIPIPVSDGETALKDMDIHVACSDSSLFSDIKLNQDNDGISLDLIPKANVSGGPVTFTIEATDEQGEMVSDSFSVSIQSQNDAPEAVDDASNTTQEDQSVLIDVLANDSDVDGDTLFISGAGTPSHGKASVVAGKIKYVPDANFSGEDSFLYTVTDGKGGNASASVTVSISPVNDAPQPVSDTASTNEDTPVSIDVLSNDSDVDSLSGDVVSLVSASDGTHGTASIQSGLVLYTPDTNWFGKDSFTYVVRDTDGLTATGTVQVIVTGVPDDPDFTGLQQEYSINEDSHDAVLSFGIFDIETQAQSLMLQAVSLDESILKNDNLQITGLGDGDPAVSLVLTPEANKFGDVTINLALGDGFVTVNRSITVHVINVNDAPQAVSDRITYNEDCAPFTIQTSTLLQNDTDIDGDTLHFVDIVSTTSHGTLTPTDGSKTAYIYTPQKDFDGTDSFTYTLSDGTASAAGTCQLVATPQNDAPSICFEQSSYETDEDTAILGINFVIHDEETSASDLILTAGSGNTDLVLDEGIGITNNGDGTGTIAVTPVGDANGTVTIQLTASDGNLAASAQCTLTVHAKPDAPVAVNDVAYVPLSGKLTFDVLENDRDVDGDTLCVASYDASSLNGLLTFDAQTQKFTYRALSGEVGTSSFTYILSDGDSATTDPQASVTLNINSAGHAPVISQIASQYIGEDSATQSIGFTVTDEDYHDVITMTATSSNQSLLPENLTDNIQITDNGDGTYEVKLIPVHDASGRSTVTLIATDSTGKEASAAFELIVAPQNDPPVATDDDITTNEDTGVALDLLANDSDPENGTIWINSITTPSFGSISRSGNSYTYTPYGNANGTETLTYSITDGELTDSATVTIHVTPQNDNPIARSNWVEIPNSEGQSHTISVLDNDSDPDGDTVHLYQIVSQGTYGTAVMNGNGTITYTRNQSSPNANGADSFVYRIIDRETADGDYRTSDATVYVGVDFFNSLYTDEKYVTCYEDASPFVIALPITNPNGVDFSLSMGTSTLGTFAAVDNTHVRFTPKPDAYGQQSISYTASQDGGGESCTGAIDLVVYPVNDAPVIDSAPSSLNCDEDSSGVAFDVVFHDADCADADLYFYAYGKNAVSGAPVALSVETNYSRSTGKANVTVVPAENANGVIDIVVGVSDGIASTQRVLPMTIDPIDDAPVLHDINTSLYEDTSITLNLLSPDTDVDGDAVMASIQAENGPSHGIASITQDGTLTYTPDADYYGSDSLTYTVSDKTATALSTSKTVDITVVSINDPPVITGLSYYQSTKEDTDKEVAFTLTDVDSDPVITLTSSNEALVPSANITVTKGTGNTVTLLIHPVLNANGATIIGVTADDSELTDHGEFQLTVSPVNDAPTALDDAADVDEVTTNPKGSTTVTINLLQNDSDVEQGTLQVVAISNVTVGTVTNNRNGTVTYAVDGDFNGTASFDYTVMDAGGLSDTATVAVEVAAKNDAPRAANDAVSISEDTTASIKVLANDTDAESDTLSVTGVRDYAGSGSVSTDGTNVSYTPATDYYGTETFYYDVSDGHGGTSSAKVTVTITPVNDPPTIDKHSSTYGEWTMQEDETGEFHFVVADAETDVKNLIITIDSKDKAKLKNTGIVLKSESDYKVLTVTPVENANGVIPIQIKVTDGVNTTSKQFDIHIDPVNDAPIVEEKSVVTTEDNAISASVSATDIEGDALSFGKASDPAHGSVSVGTDGSFTYTPAANYVGTDSFDVYADDGQAQNHRAQGTVSVTITPVNDAPDAIDDAATTAEDTSTVVSVIDNDLDSDIAYGDALTIIFVGKPAHGTAVKSNGTITYTPDANYNGTDTFTYTIADSEGETSTATVTMTISPVNDAPSGGDDTAATNEDTAVSVNVTANDDIDETTNPTLEDVLVTQADDPAHGTAAISGDTKSILYTPDANWYGTETFRYTARDAGGLQAQFTVTVTVDPVNDAPVIIAETSDTKLPDVSTNEDTATGSIQFVVQDVEDDDSTLAVTIASDNATLVPSITVPASQDDSRSFTILPKADRNGSANVTVTVTDSNGASGSDTFVLTVLPINDVPVAQNDSATTDENTAKTIDILANDDVDLGIEGDTLTITGVDTPTLGTVSVVTANGKEQLQYTPYNDRATKVNGVETLNYTMRDASGATSSAKVIITVTPVNDAPTISPIADITDILEDATNGTGDIGFDVTDEEDDDDTLAVSIACSNTALFPLANITVTNPSGGDGSERTVKAVPAANKFGTATITLTVRDAEGRTASEAYVVTVASVNDEPANGDDSFTVVEDVEKQLDVRANDDVDYLTTPDDLIVTAIVQAPEHGTARVAADGKSVYYKTAQDSNAADTFVYRLHDAAFTSGDGNYEFTVHIAVTPVNDAPVITLLGLSEYTVNEGVAKNNIPFMVTDPDNNTDADNGPVTVTLTATSSNPILVYNGVTIASTTGSNRVINVQPYRKWNGNTTITIKATDTGGLSGTAAFAFNVAAVNEAPVAVNDSFTIPEDQLTKVSVLANDTDGDLETNPDTEHLFVSSVTDNDPNAVITVTDTKDGVNIQPIANYNGPVSFTYVTEDAQGAQSDAASVSITVSQVNDAPQAQNDTAETNEDTAVSIDVLSNDTDIDQDASLNARPGDEQLVVSIDESGLLQPSHGSIAVVNNQIQYTPSANYNGTDTFEYNCDDGQALSKASVSVTVAQINDNPVAVSDSTAIDEDQSADIAVLSNDTDVDTNAGLNLGQLHSMTDLTVTGAAVSAPSHGSVSVNSNHLLFTPDANWYGSQTLTYTISDGHTGTATGTVNVTVRSVNDLPVFVTTPSDMSLTEDGSDGSATFDVSDVETAAGSLSVSVVSSSNTALIATSDVSISGTGSSRTVTVNPKNDRNGSASIKLRVTDGNGGYAEYTFSVSVAPVNDAPVGLDASATIAEDTGESFDWTALTSDADIATNSDSIGVSIQTGDEPAHGTVAIHGNAFDYSPQSNWNGVDSFTYTVTDSQGAKDTGVITITVTQANDAPTAADDSAKTNEDEAVLIDVLSNDADIDQDAGLNADPQAETLGISLSGVGLLAPSHGSVSVVSGEIQYTPDSNFNGTDAFEYYCNDGDALVKAAVQVTIDQVNDNPIAVTDSAGTADETPVSVDVLQNDTDIDTDGTLNLKQRDSADTFFVQSVSFENGVHGTVSESGGVITFSPALNFEGLQKIGYVLCDGHGGSSFGVLNILVNGENDAPEASDDTIETAEDTEVTFNVLANDTDQDPDDTMRFVMFTQNTDSLPGTIASDASGNVVFTPDANYHGSFTLSYEMSDFAGLTDTATITFIINPVNDAPTALDDAIQTQEDTQAIFDVKDLIADEDIATGEDELTVYVEEGNGPSHGAVLAAGTIFTYTPDENFNGTDSFTYTVSDKAGAKDTGVITITVNSVNDAPVAMGDVLIINEDEHLSIDVLVNDRDVDTNSALNAAPQDAPAPVDIVDEPLHGSASIADNKVLYTPDDDFNGTDSFTYRISDGESSAVGSVSITIRQVNDNPNAADDEVVTTDGDAVFVDVLLNDTDIDCDEFLNTNDLHHAFDFEITSISKPSQGTAVVDNGKILYQPNATYVGEDSFTYTLLDGHGGSDTAEVTVYVQSANDPPDTPVVHTPAEGQKYGGGSTIKVSWSGFDIDGDELSYTLEYFDGSAWQTAAMDLGATEYTFTVPRTIDSISTLQFRVCAYDGEFTSGYGYSGHVSVDNTRPSNIVVRMTTADGKAYTAGTWTNQDVTVVAVSAQDASAVTFKYALEDKSFAAGTAKTVTQGVHSVFILATDAYGNAAEFGGYQVKIDKLAPAVPTSEVALNGQEAVLHLTLLSDPGESGNRTLVMPDGQSVQTNRQEYTYTVKSNGSYAFELFDNVGNATKFSVPVDAFGGKTGDVTIDPGDVLGDAEQIRLPGGEWTDTLELKDIPPGTYTVEVKDKDGNVKQVTITITDKSVAAGFWNPSDQTASAGSSGYLRLLWLWALLGLLLLLLLLLLLFRRNVVITVYAESRDGSEKRISVTKKYRRKKSEVVIVLEKRKTNGGESASVRLSEALTRKMKGKSIRLILRDRSAHSIAIPDDAQGSFEIRIDI